jgi:hypothetical protein
VSKVLREFLKIATGSISCPPQFFLLLLRQGGSNSSSFKKVKVVCAGKIRENSAWKNLNRVAAVPLVEVGGSFSAGAFLGFFRLDLAGAAPVCRALGDSFLLGFMRPPGRRWSAIGFWF